MASAKHTVTIASEKFAVTGEGSSIRIALQRAIAKLATDVRYTSADKPLTVQIYKGR